MPIEVSIDGDPIKDEERLLLITAVLEFSARLRGNPESDRSRERHSAADHLIDLLSGRRRRYLGFRSSTV